MQVYMFETYSSDDDAYVFERYADAVAYAEARGHSEADVVEQTLISADLAADMIAQEREGF